MDQATLMKWLGPSWDTLSDFYFISVYERVKKIKLDLTFRLKIINLNILLDIYVNVVIDRDFWLQILFSINKNYLPDPDLWLNHHLYQHFFQERKNNLNK
jgi:hypothetical protein